MFEWLFRRRHIEHDEHDVPIKHGKNNFKEIVEEIKKLRRLLMATKEEVLAAIAAEKEQVMVALEAFAGQIQELKDQIEAGKAVTAADLDEVEAAVVDIYNQPPVEPPVE